MTVILQTYRGYANEQEIILFGHLYRSWSRNNYELDGKKLRHAYAVLRMFTIKPISNTVITLKFKEREFETKTLSDGYFRFSLPHTEPLSAGWHSVEFTTQYEGRTIKRGAEFIKPFPGEFGLISDIDDTFLVSYSGRFFKKLYVLLTRNINRRKIFDSVVEHYQILSHAGRKADSGSNAFFYVSSSEWNLYNFINRFAKLNEFPKAVIKLKKIKTGIADFLTSGRGNHDHKFQKIKHILEFYPELKFILLGDDSQQDPFIYERIVKIFPVSVSVIYIRQTGSKPKQKVEQVLSNIEGMDVETLYFSRSSEAVEHSKSIGFVSMGTML